MKRHQPTDLSRFPIVAIENDCISNIPTGGDRPPKGKGWEMYLFVRRQRGKQLVKDIVEVRGETMEARDAAIVDLFTSTKAKLIDREGREMDTAP